MPVVLLLAPAPLLPRRRITLEYEMGESMIWILAFVTLIVVVVAAVWQRASVAKSKDQHEHSAMTAARPDQRRSDGSEPGTQPHGQ